MALTRDFKETVNARVQRDSEFTIALLDEAISLFLNGEPETARLILRDITGQTTTIKTADISSRKEMETSMMPTGLANELSYEEFASLITFLSEQKK